MSINLYEHNETAYRAVVSMLDQYGKAAVIHPTGTGKSFIAFQLCEDHPDKTICWLSPSEYIFKTQLENLKKVSDSDAHKNIRFFTYAKLMNMTDEEMNSIRPDYIILDEFHRCGAEMWGQGVNKLLCQYPEVPVLGLSATAIRYLDNQRDMADELFDGKIASEMTLGEAIVRGILNPPRYVLSVFSYQKELEKYEKRVKNSKNKIVRKEGEKYLDALRRTLDKADGLEEIFAKHMTDPAGKYIVFCANYEHMQDMLELSKDWFYRIDKVPHIYSAYSNNPETSRAFEAFKTDNSDHLKLLYCIDMLNEGIHIDDISGVILLRPTVSPVIYKQQIGRALSANKKTNAVIFDVVFNIENLYSIGEIEDEMQIATAYYRALGEENEIVNQRFHIVDEVHDCIELFNRLDDVLSASWDLMYACAERYYEEKGNLEVPARYFTEDGYALGSWICNQRSIRKGTVEGVLTEEQINKLDSIGMRWDLYTDYTWSVNFNAAKEYYEIHGNLDVSSRYVTKDGIRLGSWLSNLRTWESSGAHPKYLTKERKQALEKIGMIWSKLDFYWENNYSAAVRYYREKGNLLVPSTYVDSDGIKLGSWISRLRKLRKGLLKRGTPPTPEQIDRLNKIGMVWDFNVDRRWNDAYALAKNYFDKHSHLNISSSYQCGNGFTLGQWLNNQRKSYKKGTLNEGRKILLNQIGMVWDPPDPWMFRYNLVKAYYDKNGTIDIDQNTVVQGVWIGKWISGQKKNYDAHKKLTDEQRELLAALPLEQVNRKDKGWFAAYNDVLAFYQEHDNLKIPSDYRGRTGIVLSDWMIRQRRAYKCGSLAADKIELLNQIYFPWEPESAWDEGYRHAKAYFEEHNNLDLLKSFRCDDGYCLGIWVFNYRNSYNGKKSPVNITEQQARMLEEIGMNWNPDTIWDKRFKQVEEFYIQNQCLPGKNGDSDSEKKMAQWLMNQRKNYRQGHLQKDQLEKLSKIGISEEWLLPRNTPFEKGYEIAKQFYEENGNLNVPVNYQDKSGFWLGAWVDKIRKKKDTLTEEQIKKLDAIGFVWEATDLFEKRFAIAKQYYEEHGFLPLEPKQCHNADELHICQWLRRQLLKRNDGKLPREQIDQLTSIGMDWMNAKERAWDRGYTKAREYYHSNGNLNVIVSYICEDGFPLGEWLHSQRTHRKRMPEERLQKLENIGMAYTS